MNEAHLIYCSSPEWAEVVEQELMPWVLQRASLTGDILEVGPGPGLTTDVLRGWAGRLTCLELDGSLASALGARLPSVDVVRGDATVMPFPPGRFDAVTIFTVLHHVPGTDLQDRVLSEAHRVLRDGGLFIGTDSLDTPARRDLHVGDVFVPLDPATFETRIEAARFRDVTVEVRGERILFGGWT